MKLSDYAFARDFPPVFRSVVPVEVALDSGIMGRRRTESRHETLLREKVYRFGRCELRVARRELLVDGTVQLVEPKAFEVLVFLIEQRARVVSKDELLDRVWKNQFVSVGVIARAIMKARQAICDNSAEPALIGTIPRVGYRFVGEIDAPTNSVSFAQPVVAAPAVRPGTMALALLPFENQTGQPELDWIELGLMSMVVNALSAGSRVTVLPISCVLTALGTLPGQAQTEERVSAVRQLPGVRQVVHVAISRERSEYVLDYGIVPQAASHRLRGPDLIQLSRLLAWALEAAMFPVGLECQV